MSLRLVPAQLTLLLASLLPLSMASGQSTALFLGGTPLDPNGWNIQLNWRNLGMPAAGDLVGISAGAFARYNVGTNNYHTLTLGQSSGTQTAMTISQGSGFRVTNTLQTNNGLLVINGNLTSIGLQNGRNIATNFSIGQGGTVIVRDGLDTGDNVARFNLESASQLLVEGTLLIGERGSFQPRTETSVIVGTTGRIEVQGGKYVGNNSTVTMQDGAQLYVSSEMIDVTTVTMEGSNSRITIDDFNGSARFGYLGDPPSTATTVNSSAGGQVVISSKSGQFWGPAFTGSNVRLSILNGTELRQIFTTQAVDLTLSGNSKLTYLPQFRTPLNGNDVNTIGRGITVPQNDSGTLAFRAEVRGGVQLRNLDSATTRVGGTLNLGSNSTLTLTREGRLWQNDSVLHSVIFENGDTPWNIGSNGTLNLGPRTRIAGAGLRFIADGNLTTRLGEAAVVDLRDINSVLPRLINRLDSSAADSVVQSGSSRLNLRHGDFAGRIESTGGLTISGTTTLRSAQNYSGGTLVSGTLNLASAGTLGSGAVTLNGTLDATAADATSLTLTNLSGSGTLRSGTRAVTFTNDTASPLTNGVSFQGTGSLTKTGTGVSNLTGSGSTLSSVAVNVGTLLVNTTVSAPVQVASGATLGGGGTTGMVTLARGSVISPGNSPGTLNTGAQTWAPGAGYLWEINAAGGTAGGAAGWDWMNVSGSVGINATAADPFRITIISLTSANVPGNVPGFAANSNYAFPILTASGGISGFDPTRFTLDATNFTDTVPGTGAFTLRQSGNQLVLNYTTIPEPGPTGLLISCGLLLASLWRRRGLCPLEKVVRVFPPGNPPAAVHALYFGEWKKGGGPVLCAD